MNRLLASKSHAACTALALAAGTATTASAIDKHWVHVGSGSWSTASNWSPAGQPGANDTVHIGNVAGVHNSTVSLDLNETIFALDITDGMTLDTSAHTLQVGVDIDVSGRNVVGTNVFPSRLVVDQIVNGPEVFAQGMSVLNQGEVQLNGGGLSFSAYMNIHGQSFLRGAGTVSLDSNFLNFRNDGTIVAGPGALSISQSGSGMYDLDGTSGGGDLDLTAASNSSITFNGGGVFEAFGGTLSLIRGTLLHMNLDEPWAVESTGTFNIYGSGSGSPARITGVPLSFGGTINLYGGSQFSLESDVTFGVNSELITGVNATADIAGDAVLNGGLFTINEGSNLDFDGATTVHGGEFITRSDESTTGSVDFNGATEWDGDITVTGFARQNGPAHVTGPTTITGDTFDMDGSNAANWDIDAYLTMNVDRIDYNGNEFNTTMDIGGGRLTVNLTDSAYWRLAGTTNLAGNSILFSTKIGSGSPLEIAGTVNVVGKVDIATSSIVASSSTINIPSADAALRFFTGSALVGSGVTFTGAGTLQNGSNGTIIFNPGVNTNGVGLHNAGTLRLGGIASVDRFQTSGTWEVSVGGHNAGTEYDRLVSNGPATLGGTLQVDLINGFEPNIGDEFTILNATGGITGSFAPNVTTTAGSATYQWDVVVGSADVVLRLASIDSCPADFNGDGFVTGDDFDQYVAEFVPGNLAADFNGDGFVTGDDFDAFVVAFIEGC